MLSIAAQLSIDDESCASMWIEALRRPDTLSYDEERCRTAFARVPILARLARRCVLVTGASRGLGFLLAMGCGLAGAHIFPHYKQSAAADEVATFIRAQGATVELLKGDLVEPGTWQLIKRQILASGGGLDLFINNAFPPILPAQFSKLDAATVRQALESSVVSLVGGLQSLLPLLIRASGTVINISSTYTRDAVEIFSSYVMIKPAVEGLLRGIAQKYRNVRFVTVRPPKLLTDQTSVNLDITPAHEPYEVTVSVLACFEKSEGSNYTEYDDLLS